MRLIEHKTALYGQEHLGRYWMRLIEHKTALYGIQIFLRTNIDTDYRGDNPEMTDSASSAKVKRQ